MEGCLQTVFSRKLLWPNSKSRITDGGHTNPREQTSPAYRVQCGMNPTFSQSLFHGMMACCRISLYLRRQANKELERARYCFGDSFFSSLVFSSIRKMDGSMAVFTSTFSTVRSIIDCPFTF